MQESAVLAPEQSGMGSETRGDWMARFSVERLAGFPLFPELRTPTGKAKSH